MPPRYEESLVTAKKCSHLLSQSLSDYNVGVLATPGDVSTGTPLFGA